MGIPGRAVQTGSSGYRRTGMSNRIELRLGKLTSVCFVPAPNFQELILFDSDGNEVAIEFIRSTDQIVKVYNLHVAD